MSEQVQSYAVLGFIVRHGNTAAAVLTIVALATFLVLYMAYAMPGWTIAVAIVVSIVTYGLLRSYVEIVQVIAETLLPR